MTTPGDAELPAWREQWIRGDWHALAARELDDAVARHPSRRRLALMVLAARHALGDRDGTRQAYTTALDWGCPRGTVLQTLTAGVHNTLARAAASASLPERARRHFALALDAIDGGASEQAAEARAGEQLRQIGLPCLGMPDLRVAPQTSAAGHGSAQDTELNAALAARIESGFQRQHKTLTSVRSRIETTLRHQVANAVRQIEAFGSLQRYLAGLKPIPTLHGWAISADFAMLLVEMLEERDYDLVIEFGSGTSTLLIATAVSRRAAQRRAAGRPAVRALTFEHQARYHEKTAHLLASHGLAETVHLELAPLCLCRLPDQRVFPFYDAQQRLAQAARDAADEAGPGAPPLRVLLLVDGPPADVAPRARYPALPLVLAHFPDARFDVVLDDYDREDDKAVAQAWMQELQAGGRLPEQTEIALEKGACVLRF
ncbi:hypothetical protein LOC51_27610 [Rubrivivax sp. JA1024]|nr:hypothetical protein [Rubrivivax sp. JA1024]